MHTAWRAKGSEHAGVCGAACVARGGYGSTADVAEASRKRGDAALAITASLLPPAGAQAGEERSAHRRIHRGEPRLQLHRGNARGARLNNLRRRAVQRG